jgi:hypothetical protein
MTSISSDAQKFNESRAEFRFAELEAPFAITNGQKHQARDHRDTPL